MSDNTDAVAKDEARIADAILRLTAAHAPAGSISPSEAAQALDGAGWRRLLGPVRRVAAQLAREGRIEVIRKGRPIAPEEIRGVIRLRAARTPA
jgi:Protein of unknown function (DUF3253)